MATADGSGDLYLPSPLVAAVRRRVLACAAKGARERLLATAELIVVPRGVIEPFRDLRLTVVRTVIAAWRIGCRDVLEGQARIVPLATVAAIARTHRECLAHVALHRGRLPLEP